MKFEAKKEFMGNISLHGFRGNYDNFHDSLQDNAMVWFANLQKILYQQFWRISKYQLQAHSKYIGNVYLSRKSKHPLLLTLDPMDTVSL